MNDDRTGEAFDVERLAEALLIDAITDTEREKLENRIATDPEIRRAYVQYIYDSLNLYDQSGQPLEGILDTEELPPHDEKPAPTVRSKSLLQRASRHSVASAIAVAVAVMLSGLATLHFMEVGPFVAHADKEKGSESDETSDSQHVARLKDWRNVVWLHSTRPPLRDPRLVPGRRLAIASGLLEIEYTTGATVVIEGPADFWIVGSESAQLQLGKVVANVADESGKGFAIDTPMGRVTDFGTEFGVEVRSDEVTSIHVFDGVVQLQTEDGKKRQLHREESVRVARGKITSFDFDPRKYRFTRVLPQPTVPPGWITWKKSPLTNANQIIAEGTQVVALNLNGCSVVTMNGVEFVPGNFGEPYSDPDYFDHTTRKIVGLTDSAANDLLDRINYGPGIGNSLIPKNAVSGLSGLKIGSKYTIQVILCDQRSVRINKAYDFGHGAAETYTLQNANVSQGPVVFTGTFTASDTTQDVHIQLDFTNQLNYSIAAWQLREEKSPDLEELKETAEAVKHKPRENEQGS